MTIKRVSLSEASGHLAELVEAARRGDEVVIEAAGQASVQLVPVPTSRPARQLGAYRGKIRMSEDFNAPISEDAWLSGQL